MGKIRISPMRKISTKNTVSKRRQKKVVSQGKELQSIKDFCDLERFDTKAYLLDQENVGEAILDCLINNDPEGVIEILSIYLNALNKEKFRQKANVGKSTYYYLMKYKNPTVKTLAKIVHSMTH